MDMHLVNRLIELVRRNGDRLILPDQDGGNAVVVMDLESYEELTRGAEGRRGEGAERKRMEEAVERKNDSVQSRQDAVVATSASKVSSPEQPPRVIPVLTPEDAGDKINREIGDRKSGRLNQPLTSPKQAEIKASNQVNQPPVQQVVQETAAPAPANQLEEEERFYLEPIE